MTPKQEIIQLLTNQIAEFKSRVLPAVEMNGLKTYSKLELQVSYLEDVLNIIKSQPDNTSKDKFKDLLINTFPTPNISFEI